MTPAQKLRESDAYWQIAGSGQISRRFLAINALDGVLVTIGVLLGSFIAGIRDPFIVLYTGLAAVAALAISGIWGAHVVGAAERRRELAELEHAIRRRLSDTSQARASRLAMVVVTAIGSLSPLVAGCIVLAPFLLPGSLVAVRGSYYASLGIATTMLFALGVFLARVARESIVRSGVRMLAAGVVCGGLYALLSIMKGH